MRRKIFIINGSGGVGKDTFVKLFAEEAKNSFGITTENYSSIDKVKEIARKYFGWEGGKSEKDRKFLSDLKCFLTAYDDLPFRSMRDKAEEFAKSYRGKAVLFFHIREPEEIQRAKKEFSGMAEVRTILVTRDSVPQITSNMADANVFNYPYDITIKNNSNIEALKCWIKQFINDICHNRFALVYDSALYETKNNEDKPNLETNKIQRNWCNNGKCSECMEGCRLDDIIPCTPDCENLTDDGRIKIGDCIRSGCDAALSIFGYTDRKEMEEAFKGKEITEYPFDYTKDVSELNNAADEVIKESDRNASVREYYPKFEDGFLLIDSHFDDESGLDFADKHNFNVKFTDTGSSILAKIMLMFAQKGYRIEVVGEPSYAPDGRYLCDKPIVLFRKEWTQ